MLTNPQQLYLTETDSHQLNPFSSSKLRTYILMNTLFNDQLLVSDAQINNNPALRYLLYEKEPHSSAKGKVDNLKRDLSTFLKEGYLLPMIRKGSSLTKLREYQEKKATIGVSPSEDYVRDIEEKLQGQKVSYDIIEVAKLFKRRALINVAPEVLSGSGLLTETKAKMVQTYFEERNPQNLEWADLRRWMMKNDFTTRDIKLVDKKLKKCYTNNLPEVVGAKVDVPTEEKLSVEFMLGSQRTFDRRIREREISKEIELPPIVCLSESFLSKVRADAFLEIKGSRNRGIKAKGYYKKVVKNIKDFQDADKLNVDDFIESLVNYVNKIEPILIESMIGNDKSEYLKLKNKHKQKALLKIYRNNAVSLIGLIPSASLFSFFYTAYCYVEDSDISDIEEAHYQGYLLREKAYNQGIISLEEKLLIGTQK